MHEKHKAQGEKAKYCARRSDLDRNCRFLARGRHKPFNRYLERECHMKTRSATSNTRRTLLRRGRDLLSSVSKRRGRGRGKAPDVMDLLSESQRAELGQIHLALERIERGIFGICEGCSERISEERLLAVPWKAACESCESQLATAPSTADLGAPTFPI